MPKIEVYSKDYCPYCHRAIELLTAKGAHFSVIDVEHDMEKLQEMRERSQRRTVPQIFIDDQHIGGCDDLLALDAQGKLDPLLKTKPKQQ